VLTLRQKILVELLCLPFFSYPLLGKALYSLFMFCII